MKLHRTFFYICLAMLFFGSPLSAQNTANSNAQLKYPATQKIEVRDTLWGTIYKDNYRWLEKNMKDPKVISWFKQQANLSDDVMNTISGRDELIAEWRKLKELHPPVFSYDYEAGGRYFYFIKFPKDKVSKVNNREAFYGVDKLIFDLLNHIPGNTLSVGSINPSSDGKQLLTAYSAKRIGSLDIKKLPLSDSFSLVKLLNII